MKTRHRSRRSTRRLTQLERRNRVIATAVKKVDLAGTRDRPNRQDWAESRKQAGWSERLVDDAIGADALAKVRAVVDGREEQPECRCRPETNYVCRWCRAVQALPIVDSGRSVEVTLPRYPETDAEAQAAS